MSFPRNLTKDDRGCLVRRVSSVGIGMDLAHPGGSMTATLTTWECTFWAHGTVFIGLLHRPTQPSFGDIALDGAINPHRWMTLPVKPAA